MEKEELQDYIKYIVNIARELRIWNMQVEGRHYNMKMKRHRRGNKRKYANRFTLSCALENCRVTLKYIEPWKTDSERKFTSGKRCSMSVMTDEHMHIDTTEEKIELLKFIEKDLMIY